MRKLSGDEIKALPARMTAAEFVRRAGDHLSSSPTSAMPTRSGGASHSKWKNKGVLTAEGYFHSTGELERWGELKLLAQAGVISELRRQVKITLEVDGVWVSDYFADFTYTENGIYCVEDFKGVETAYFKLKKRLFYALKKIEIRLTKKLKKNAARRRRTAPPKPRRKPVAKKAATGGR